MSGSSLSHLLNRGVEVSEKPLVAILVSPDGPEEVWVLGREALGGQPTPEDVSLGRRWVEKFGWTQGPESSPISP